MQKYTKRQMLMFFAQACRREQQARADLIEDVNTGMHAGRKAAERVRKLRGN
jgi:hypothetical protein